MKDKKQQRGHQPENDEGLIPKFGGYRNTKSWQLAELIYDVTVRFCDKFVDSKSRTHDQMEQAARSGTRNLSEGSVDSGTSKKIEIKLTGIALGSLDELSRDYASFLKHHGLPEWTPDHPALARFKALRCATFDQFRAWVTDETRRGKNTEKNTGKNTDKHGLTRTGGGDDIFVRVSPCRSVSVRVIPHDCKTSPNFSSIAPSVSSSGASSTGSSKVADSAVHFSAVGSR